MRRFLAVGIAAAVLVIGGAAVPANACGCGIVTPPDGVAARATDERAIVSMVDGVETIEFTADMLSKAKSVGLLIPTPTTATVEAGDARTFDLIENLIKPTVTDEADIWGYSHFVAPPKNRETNGAERVQLGPFVVSRIAPGDVSTMKKWLKKNDFVMSDEAAAAMTLYANQGWSITAVRLDASQSLKGHIDPIRLSFRTKELVYPMRFARLSTVPTSIRLYVFSDKRSYLAQANQRVTDLSAPVTTDWAGPTPDPRLENLGDYLTVLNVDLSDPPQQATSDIGIIESRILTDVTETTPRYHVITLLGIPVGSLVVGWLLIGILLITVWAVRRYRAR
jgi:hypothetical protein